MSSTSALQGYIAVPVKYAANSSAQHVLFVKQHTVREKSIKKPSDRTLFVLNVPPYCTKRSIQLAWRECGNVTAVYFHSRPTAVDPREHDSPYFSCEEDVKGFKVAYVVFEKPSELQKALKWNGDHPLILSSPEEKLICGMQKWCENYNSNIPDVAAMKNDIDMFMALYDKRVNEKIAKDNEEDDEGWTTVTRGGRNPGLARSERVIKNVMAKEEKKRSKKQLLNFYSFQVRESKMKNLIKLRQKFEEDKKKIETLKQMRKFKPF